MKKSLDINQNFKIPIFFLLIFILISFNSVQPLFTPEKNDQISQIKSSDEVIITIDETNPSLNWDQYSWISGDGTYDNPYIIENLELNGQYVYFDIVNCRSFCLIRNCSFTGAGYDESGFYTGRSAINIFNSSLISVYKCTFIDLIGGIFTQNAFNISIQRNYCYNNSIGIETHQSHDILINENILKENIFTGVSLGSIFEVTITSFSTTISSFNYGSYKIEVSNNQIFSNYYGLQAGASSDILIENNSIHDNDFGIGFYQTNSVLTKNNSFQNNSIGFILYDEKSTNNTISDNSFFNSKYAFFAYKGNNFTIFNNSIENCEFSGIYCRKTTSGVIQNNTISNCTHSAINCIESDYIKIKKNEFKGGDYGVFGNHSQFLIISENYFQDHKIADIFLDSASYCTIQQNIFDKSPKIYIVSDSFGNLVDEKYKTKLNNNIPGYPIHFLIFLIGISGILIFLRQNRKIQICNKKKEW